MSELLDGTKKWIAIRTPGKKVNFNNNVMIKESRLLFLIIAIFFFTTYIIFADDDISVKIYPLTDKSYEHVSIEKICYVSTESVFNAIEAGFTVIDLAVIELNAPYPGILSTDPFYFRGEKEITKLGGNAWTLENILEYEKTKGFSDVALKAYRIEWNGRPITICGTTLDEWKMVAGIRKDMEEFHALKNNAYYKKRKKVIDKKYWEIYYNAVKEKYLRLKEEQKKEIPNVGLFLKSSNTFISCFAVMGRPELSEFVEAINCPISVSSDTFKKEIETYNVMISSMPKANIPDTDESLEKASLKELKELMTTDPESYKDFADLYYTFYKRWPVEDPRYVKPKDSGSQV